MPTNKIKESNDLEPINYWNNTNIYIYIYIYMTTQKRNIREKLVIFKGIYDSW